MKRREQSLQVNSAKHLPNERVKLLGVFAELPFKCIKFMQFLLTFYFGKWSLNKQFFLAAQEILAMNRKYN